VQHGRQQREPRRLRVCRLCLEHGFEDPRFELWQEGIGSEGEADPADSADEEGQGPTAPVDDFLHFLVECRIPEPVRCEERFRPLFQPSRLYRSDASTLARYIMNYHDQVLLADALLALQQRRAGCLELARNGRLDTRDLDLPDDWHMRREVAWEAYDDAPHAEQLQHVWY
jgi:hypothetical protein